MIFSALREVIRVSGTDRPAQSPEPQSRPGELYAEDRESNRNHNYCRTRRYQHDYADQQDRRAH